MYLNLELQKHLKMAVRCYSRNMWCLKWDKRNKHIKKVSEDDLFLKLIVIILRTRGWRKSRYSFQCSCIRDSIASTLPVNVGGRNDNFYGHSIVNKITLPELSSFYWAVRFPCNMPRQHVEGGEVELYYFFNLGARWEWVIIFTPRPFYPRDKPQNQLREARRALRPK